MKNNFKSYTILILSAIFVLSMGFISQGNHPLITSTIKQTDLEYPKVFALSDPDKEWVESTLNAMTLREKCAQMIIIPVYRSFMDSTSADYDSTIALVRNYKVGGLIMFQGELKQEINFIKQMQALAEIPLLISADYERGLGMRIDDALEFPHNMALGSTANSQLAYEMGKAIAIESRLIGVHQNFAPVADINDNALNPVINIRSFSESKFTVAEFVSSFILGTKHGRIISTAKHFPGHGNTDIDSHTELPVISGDKNYLLQNELYPFILSINSGVQSIMIGHPVVQAYDTLPAPLSKNIVTGLLTNTLGFDGLIITDALNMNAINDNYSLEETITLSVKAGNDIILMPLDPQETINILYNAVKNDEIIEERINHSVRKILAAKRWLKMDSDLNQTAESISDSLKKLLHLKLAQTIADQSITLLKNKSGVIPFNPSNYNNIFCLTVTDGVGDETATYFSNITKRRIGNINSILVTEKTKGRELRNYLTSLKEADLILMSVFMEVKEIEGKEKLRKDQITFIKNVLNLRAPVVTMSFKNPYLLNLLPGARTYINSYSYTDVSQSACLKALLGEINIMGKLPVSIPQSEFHIGMGINLDKTLNTELSYSIDRENKFIEIDDLVINSIQEEDFSSASIAIGYYGSVIYQKTFESSGLVQSKNKRKKPGFNVGTLTIPVALTSAIMHLVDYGLISLSDNVYYYLPGFEINGKSSITIENLLLNNSGIGSRLDSLNINWDKKELETALINVTPEYPIGHKTLPSNLNLLLTQFIVENISGQSLDIYLSDLLFNPIGMKNTYYLKSAYDTQENLLNNNNFLKGGLLSQSEIIKKIMGGITGFDGLHSTIDDLAIFTQMLIQNGYYDGKQYYSASTVKEFTSSQLPKSYAALGWHTYLSDIDVSRTLSENCYGYNSDLGSSLWINPEGKLFIIFLTNSDIEKTKLIIPKIQDEAVGTIIER